MSLVKYLAVGRLIKENGNFVEDQHQIISNALAQEYDPQDGSYKSHVKQIMNKGATKLKPGKRVRLTSDENDYELHVMAEQVDSSDEHTIVLFAVTDTSFGKNYSIQSLLKDFKSGIFRVCDSSELIRATSKGAIQKKSEPIFKDIFARYGSSKLKEVQTKVDEVKNVMRDNVDMAIGNVEKLEEMESKSVMLDDQSRAFAKKSAGVKRMMRCRNYKMVAIVTTVIIIILVILGIIIWQATK